MIKELIVLLCLLSLVVCLPSLAEGFRVVQPNLSQVDKSGELGKELNYLCLRQLGADCRERLVYGSGSYLKDMFTQAKPGQQMHEPQIRPIAGIVFAGSTLLTFGAYDEKATGFSRREMAKTMLSLTRELSEHHISNCDKSSWWWGDEWQSAYWCALAGQGAWLMWDRLPASTQQEAANMVAHEADRFLAGSAPHNEFSDTKAEENAWNSEVIVLAICMMPDHPHHAAWEEKAKEYIITSFATPEDVKSTDVIDGKPLKDWLRGPNVHSDFTMENHGFFHPDYTSSYYLTMQNLPFYALSGQKVPESMYHNVAKIHDIITYLTMPNGWTFYPQCTDWGNNRNDVTIMAQMTNPLITSPTGSRCLRWGLECIKHADSLNLDKTSVNLFRSLNFNCCPLDTMTHVYLQHYLFGPGAEPLSDEQTREKLAGTRHFEQAKVVVCRSKNSMASFSWFDSSRRLMACVSPMAMDCITIPKFRSLIGTVDGKIDDAKIVSRTTELPKDGGFIVHLAIKRGPGLVIDEKVVMMALPDGRTIWAEWFSDVPKGTEIHGGLVFLETNPIWLRDAQAKVYYPNGTWDKTTKPVTLASMEANWLNVSDRFGIVVRGSKAVSIEDGQLILNHSAANGDGVSTCSIVVFYPNLTRQATIQSSEKLRISNLGAGAVTVDLGDKQLVLDPNAGVNP